MKKYQKKRFFIITDLEHSGEDCWSGCLTNVGHHEGKCDWCGNAGWCCKNGQIGNGCDGTFGGADQHECVLNPGNFFFRILEQKRTEKL